MPLRLFLCPQVFPAESMPYVSLAGWPAERFADDLACPYDGAFCAQRISSRQAPGDFATAYKGGTGGPESIGWGELDPTLLESQDCDVDHASPECKIEQRKYDVPEVPPLGNALQ